MALRIPYAPFLSEDFVSSDCPINQSKDQQQWREQNNSQIVLTDVSLWFFLPCFYLCGFRISLSLKILGYWAHYWNSSRLLILQCCSPRQRKRLRMKDALHYKGDCNCGYGCGQPQYSTTTTFFFIHNVLCEFFWFMVRSVISITIFHWTSSWIWIEIKLIVILVDLWIVVLKWLPPQHSHRRQPLQGCHRNINNRVE